MFDVIVIGNEKPFSFQNQLLNFKNLTHIFRSNIELNKREKKKKISLKTLINTHRFTPVRLTYSTKRCHHQILIRIYMLLQYWWKFGFLLSFFPPSFAIKGLLLRVSTFCNNGKSLGNEISLLLFLFFFYYYSTQTTTASYRISASMVHRTMCMTIFRATVEEENQEWRRNLYIIRRCNSNLLTVLFFSCSSDCWVVLLLLVMVMVMVLALALALALALPLDASVPSLICLLPLLIAFGVLRKVGHISVR